MPQSSRPAHHRILGIDPGSRVTGFGVIENTTKGLRHIDSGCIRLSQDDLWLRLKMIYDGITEVIESHKPNIVVVEKVFVSNNANSALILGHARGSAICAAVNCGVPIVEYTALQVKRAVVGSGGAAKQQVQHMVRALLGLTANPPSDAADALGCAICHLHTSHIEDRLKAAS
ncbi:MAG: crossover junction endodeoxyribonuclease RuvC [Gammaproteobacteria bacterium]|nr:crossover junction endodeoxyribonuclease RuvC [Gammaproteobacteria bacterium]